MCTMYPTHRRTRGALARALLVASLVAAAVGGAAAEQLPTKAYTVENGLAHNRIKHIMQDSRGFLWFCTADGLSRFDGNVFTNYQADDGLFAPSINDLVEARDGTYWVAPNSDGVFRFNPRAGVAAAPTGAPPPATACPAPPRAPPPTPRAPACRSSRRWRSAASPSPIA